MRAHWKLVFFGLLGMGAFYVWKASTDAKYLSWKDSKRALTQAAGF